jgi:hypothetical protein
MAPVRPSTSAAVSSCSARSRIARHLRRERAADDEKGEGPMGDEYDDMLDSGLTTEGTDSPRRSAWTSTTSPGAPQRHLTLED